MRMFLVLMFVALASAGYAIDGSTLSQQVYCDVKGIFSGSLGLLVGFGVALYGLLSIIKGNTASGILMIMAGAAVTMLPNIVESSLGGVANVLNSSNISNGASFTPAGC